MRCPYCGGLDTQVKDSRPTDDSASIRRRRICPDCGGRFTTFERVQLRELQVVKKNGRRAPFDRDKLMRSVQVALRKRSVEPERVEQLVSKIVRELESIGESEITSETIGEAAMKVSSGLCRSFGSGPTTSMPSTAISSAICWMPMSASPRSTTSPARPAAPPAPYFALACIAAAMPSCSNTLAR